MMQGSWKILLWSVTAMLAATIVIICLWKAPSPIQDPDFWWHIKTGQQIVTARALPLRDDFTFTSGRFDTASGQATLRGYPITQIALYALYSSMGGAGIMAARLLLCMALIVVVLVRSRRMGVGLPVSLATLCAGLAVFLSSYSLERPQVASFLFFALLMGVLERVDREERPTVWLFPLMLLWANCHGGFIIGGICLALFALGFLFRSGFSRTGWLICAWSAGGILVSLINPNGYFYYRLILTPNIRSFGFIQEFHPVWSDLLRGEQNAVIMTVMALIWAVGAIINGRRSLPLFLVSAFIVAISFRYSRNVPFFSLGMAPAVAAAIESLTKRRHGRRDYAPVAGVVCGVLALVGVWTHPYEITRPSFAIPVTVSWYPAKATAFIANTSLNGGLFNEYNWGGYLIWNLYPRQRVFIDGRVLDLRVYDDYLLIAKGTLGRTPQGRFVYAHLLDTYRVDVIVQSIIQMQHGGTQPLMGRLLDDPVWIPVYLDNQAYIFVRSGTNERIVASNRIEKPDFLLRLEGVMRNAANGGADIRYVLGMADLLIYKNRLAEAGAVLTDADRRQPGSPQVRQRLEFIAKQGIKR